MSIRTILGTIIVVICTILTVPAYGALVDISWQSVGDNLITRDTSSGLDWLDLSVSNNMSFNMVVSELVSGGQFDGWRYATNSEVVALWSNFGIDLSGTATSRSDGLDPNVVTAVSFLGNTFCEYDCTLYPNGVTGITSELQPFDNISRFGAFHRISDEFIDTQYQNGTPSIEKNVARLFFGSYLVQVSPVPIPAAVWLFGSGLIGLIGIARIKKS